MLKMREKSDIELKAARMSAVASYRITELLDHMKINPVNPTHSSPGHVSMPADCSSPAPVCSIYGQTSSNHSNGSTDSTYGSSTYHYYAHQGSPHSSTSTSSGIYASAIDEGHEHAHSKHSTIYESWPVDCHGRRDLRYFWHDQAVPIEQHTAKGIEFLERYGGFLKERAAIEDEYASKLRSLIKKNAPKKKEETTGDFAFSYGQAFIGVLKELGDMAGQHEVISEAIKNDIQPDLANTSKSLREDRKFSLVEANGLHQQLTYTTESMNKTKKEYVKTFKEAQAAHYKHEKADANMDISRAELEKAKNNAHFRAQQCEDAKNAYALCLQKANDQQRLHYTQAFPNVLEKLRQVDEARIGHIRRMIDRSVDLELSTLPLVKKCLDEMKHQANRVNATADSAAVVDKYRTGYAPPTDMPFEDLGDPMSSTGSGSDLGMSNGGQHYGSNDNENGSQGALNGGKQRAVSSKQSRKSATLGRAHSGRSKTTKSLGERLFGTHKAQEFQEDYSDLPPSQRCQKLNKKLKQLQKDMDTKTSSRDGLLKMQQLYRTQPHLGDLQQVEKQLAEYDAELEAVQQEIAKFQNYLREAEGHMNQPMQTMAPAALPPNSNANARLSPRPPPPSGPTPTPPSSQRNSQASTSLPRGMQPPHLATNERTSISDQDSLSSEGSSALNHMTPKANGGQIPPAPVLPGMMGAFSASHNATGRVNGKQGASPESGIVLQDSSRLDEADGSNNGDDVYNDIGDPLPVLGTAKALFAFDGGADGCLALKDQEDLLLIERDEGDGWTRVRRGNAAEEGFAPTSYLECKWYPN